MSKTEAQGTGFFKKKSTPRSAPIRVLTASATRLKLDDRKDARKQRAFRQGWQEDAWGYRDSIGELRYAVRFLANCTSRMRIYPAAYPTAGETDLPVPLAEIPGVPPNVVAACNQAMSDLGDGKLAIANLLSALSTNTTVAGECYLVGMQDPETGIESWDIRSIDEIVITDDAYKLRELPSDPNGATPWITLDPDTTVVSRIWSPHPRFQVLADSPLRAIMDDCESLLILRRMIRATGRSRLAGRGMLLIPDELSIKVPQDDNADPESDPIMAALAEAMMQPINDEGVASAVVPIVIRGPGDTLDKVKHLDFASTFDKDSIAVREELVGIIATGLDIPKEVITGVSDLNHWTAWQVDDNTFRHHVEPHVIECCDSLTAAYLQPYLQAFGVPQEWVDRIVFWYDPTELVTHPDQTEDAMQLHDRMVLSDEALLKTSGFTPEDAPSTAEKQVRLIQAMRTWPPNLVMEILHMWDPSLVVPPITVAGTVPGIKPGGVDLGTPPPPPAEIGVSPPAAPVGSAGGPPATPGAVSPGRPADSPATPAPVTASGASKTQKRLSRKLVEGDRDLRVKLQTAANAAMLRQLERAGAKMRTKVAKDETLRTKIAHRPNELVASTLGQDVILAAGLTGEELMGGDWSNLRKQYMDWTSSAQKNAIATAVRIGGLMDSDDAVATATAAMDSQRDVGWSILEKSLNELGQQLLYSPHPNDDVPDVAELNPDTLVPAGTIRAAVAAAGGDEHPEVSAYGADGVVGQVGTGTTIHDLLTSAGADKSGYEWVHGPALNPFEPHESLDGVEFEGFDDEQLANNSGFPDNAYYLPGDHTGCQCDFMPLWVSPGE